MKRTGLRRTHTPVHVRGNSGPTLDTINRLLNISCASAQVETILVREKLKVQQLRPQLHVLLQSQPGAMKTTILDEIGRSYGVTACSYATYAAMIGSIDRTTGHISNGLVWEARKKPLLLDEFRTGERGDAGAIDVLLGVMESGHYKRKIAVPSLTFEEHDGPLYYRVKDGEIEVQTSFPCIIATMKNLDMARSDKVRALVQRCVPIRYDLPDEVVDAALQGSTLYRQEPYNPPKKIKLSQKDYATITSLAAEIRSENKRFRETYARAVGDLCRVFSVLGRHDEHLYRVICHLKAGHYIGQAIQLAGGLLNGAS